MSQLCRPDTQCMLLLQSKTYSGAGHSNFLFLRRLLLNSLSSSIVSIYSMPLLHLKLCGHEVKGLHGTENGDIPVCTSTALNTHNFVLVEVGVCLTHPTIHSSRLSDMKIGSAARTMAILSDVTSLRIQIIEETMTHHKLSVGA
jgi:hypothetical protein